MTTSDEARIARRYPKRSLFDYLLFGGLGLGVAVVIAVAAIAGLEQSTPEVAGEVRNFEVVSPTQVDVEIVVQREDPAAAAECSVYAQASSYEEVGEAVLPVPPGEEKLESYTFSLATVKEAVSIAVENCWITGR
ncbi:MAG: DUF4307 domain-containing protein [Propionibacterium sp.]|nr:DUF4307 domain-containing protein [Propionibacterium sp.]